MSPPVFLSPSMALWVAYRVRCSFAADSLTKAMRRRGIGNDYRYCQFDGVSASTFKYLESCLDPKIGPPVTRPEPQRVGKTEEYHVTSALVLPIHMPWTTARFLPQIRRGGFTCSTKPLSGKSRCSAKFYDLDE